MVFENGVMDPVKLCSESDPFCLFVFQSIVYECKNVYHAAKPPPPPHPERRKREPRLANKIIRFYL